MLGSGIKVIFAQWSSLTYLWIFAEVNALTSFEMIIAGSLLLSLPLISSLLKPILGSTSRVDIFIAQTSVFANVLGLILMALAPSRETYVIAMAVWTLGVGLSDSLRSYVTGLLESKEAVEKLYLGIGMVETLGGMLATAFWSGILAEVLGKGYWLERIPFVASSAILVVVLGFVFVLGRFGRKLAGLDGDRNGNGNDKENLCDA
jgi:hypothetical protein